jgi:dTDP-3,4-didehydro-2,6-dideoxy-alpha-D-glucose 3-reductase
MKTLRVGLMGCASFARRTMIPALRDSGAGELTVVASRDPAKAAASARELAVEGLAGYQALLSRSDVDAVYLPLPVSLHEEWVCAAFRAGKHVLVEKSAATSLATAERMVEEARRAQRLLVENFAFPLHEQMRWILAQLGAGALGRVHLLRSTFGFPRLPPENIRNQKALGGGARLDAGCYTFRVARLLLGDSLHVIAAHGVREKDSGLDLRAEVLCANAEGQTALLAYGFDYHYQCELELLGSQGKLTAERIFTAPKGMAPALSLERAGQPADTPLLPDHQFARMWTQFAAQAVDPSSHESAYREVLQQAAFMDAVAGAIGEHEEEET